MPDPPTMRRVLVVQNEPTLRLGFSYALTSPSMQVDVAATGQETLDRVENTYYDLVILELRMPGIDGIGVIEELRSRRNQTPIVLCTAMHRPNATLRAIRLGVVDYLIKPLKPSDLRGMVEFVLDQHLDPFWKAMRAARLGEWDEAIGRLQDIRSPEPSEIHWLKILTLVRDHPKNDDISDLDEQVRASFPFLAFNGSVAQ